MSSTTQKSESSGFQSVMLFFSTLAQLVTAGAMVGILVILILILNQMKSWSADNWVWNVQQGLQTVALNNGLGYITPFEVSYQNNP
jgi:hypothetical protein